MKFKVSGWTKYYGGEITRKNRDGTYDIKFDDGERKSGVKTSQIKSKKNHHQKRNHQVVEVTTMKVMLMVIMMDMSVVIVLKLKLVDGLSIMVVKLHVKWRWYI